MVDQFGNIVIVEVVKNSFRSTQAYEWTSRVLHGNQGEFTKAGTEPFRTRIRHLHSQTKHVRCRFEVLNRAKPPVARSSKRQIATSRGHPKPVVSLPPCYGAIVSRHTHGPSSRVAAQAFQMQTRVCRFFSKLAVSHPGGLSNVRRQLPEESPKGPCAVRSHEWRSNSASDVSGQSDGFCRYSASA